MSSAAAARRALQRRLVGSSSSSASASSSSSSSSVLSAMLLAPGPSSATLGSVSGSGSSGTAAGLTTLAGAKNAARQHQHQQQYQRAVSVPLPSSLLLLGQLRQQRRGLATSTSTSSASSASEEACGSEAEEAPLPHMQRPTDAELEAEALEDAEDEETKSNMKDGLAIKMATSSFAGRRRFYKRVGVREAKATGTGATGAEVQHYEVTLDGYPLKTPGTEKPYRIPTRGLALAVALEWDQQVTYKGVEPTYMPITGMATIALDEIIFSRQSTIDRCLRYLATDTVCFCFPDEEDDRKLLRRQQKAWEPLLAWLRDDFGIHIAKPAHLLATCENSPETLRKVAIVLQEMDAFTLAGTLSLVLDLKSVITALALVFRHITVDEACQASALEEAHQKAAWGHVDLYHELDETVLYSQVAAASTFLWLLDDQDRLHVRDLKRRVKARLRQEFPDSTPPDRD